MAQANNYFQAYWQSKSLPPTSHPPTVMKLDIKYAGPSYLPAIALVPKPGIFGWDRVNPWEYSHTKKKLETGSQTFFADKMREQGIIGKWIFSSRFLCYFITLMRNPFGQ